MSFAIPYAVLCFIGTPLVLLPLPLYARARNWPIIYYIVWLSLTAFTKGVNAILWSNNIDIKAEWWCELAIRVQYASTFALECCSVLLLRRLEAIAATRVVKMTDSSKKRQFWLEFGVGVCLPILYIALGAISQGHRFDIMEQFGCTINIYNTAVSIVFTSIPPLVAGLAALTYAAMCTRWLIIRRRQFSAVLHSSASGIDKSHYYRLFGLIAIEMVWTVPNVFVAVFTNLVGWDSQIYKFTSWADVHYGFSAIDVYPTSFLKTRKTWPFNLLTQWTIPVSCFLFFAFLGTSRDSLRLYSRCLSQIPRLLFCLGQKDKSRKPTTRGVGSSRPSHLNDEENSISLSPQSHEFSKTYEQDESGSFAADAKKNEDEPSFYDSSIMITVEKFVQKDEIF